VPAPQQTRQIRRHAEEWQSHSIHRRPPQAGQGGGAVRRRFGLPKRKSWIHWMQWIGFMALPTENGSSLF
jgi:hypothetical protein